jgi:hypothetical protein
MKFYDVEQNTDEWLDMRMAKLTGSGCSKVMANYGKAFGVPAKNLAVSIAREQTTGLRAYGDSYSNAHMERGHEQEPIARDLYEAEYFVTVSNGGFFDCGNYGCSPDGLVYDDGLIEIKSVIDNVHYANIKRNNIDPSYKWQIYFNLLKTEREWIDFVSYCADFPINKRLFVYRVTKKECSKQFEMIEKRTAEFFDLVEEIKKDIN